MCGSTLDCLTILFDAEEITLRPYMLLADVLALLKNRNYRIDPDPAINATYLELIEDGVDIVFKSDRMSSVFLFIDPVPPRTDRFSSRCNVLSHSFWAAPSPARFSTELQALGFKKSARAFPDAIDYLNDKVRLRFEDRMNRAMILFDDGSRIRGS